MPRRIAITLAAATLAAAASGCATAPEKQPPERPSETAPGPTNDPNTDPALSVSKPKNLAAASSPCSLLTPEQLEKLGQEGESKEKNTIYDASKCVWSGDNFALTLTLKTNLKRGAKRMYQDAEANGFPERFKIADYPAAYQIKESSMATIEAAVSETETFSVAYTKHSGKLPGMEDPEGYSKKIASEVLKNIPDA